MLSALIVLAALALASADAAAASTDPVQATTIEGAAAQAPQDDGPARQAATEDALPVKAKAPRHPQRLTPEQVIDERVQRLARSLDLDETQQAKLRGILENEHRQISTVRTESPPAGVDRVGLMLAILDRTREEIRAMLSEEQRKKYPAAVPRGSTAPASADLDFWMRRTQPPPPQGTEQGH
jgi:hypothetical protein